MKMGSAKVPLYRKIAGLISIGVIRLTRLLPLPVARGMMLCLGRLAYCLVPRIRKIGMQNLNLAYGSALPQAEKKRILKGSVDNIALVAAEFSRSSLIGKNLGRYVTLDGAEKLNLARGGVIISAHVANWEWMVAGAISVQPKIIAVVRTLDEPRLNAVVDQMRRDAGLDTIPKDNAGPTLFMRMGEGWFAGIVADQCPSNSAVPTTFFGQPCWSTIGPAMLAIKANVPVYPVQMVREAGGHYRMTFLEPLHMECTGNTRDDILHNTQRIQNVIETMVRAHPEQWLWLHRRWKPRPRLEEEWAARLKG